jgi:CRP-like cAMP-binding protein
MFTSSDPQGPNPNHILAALPREESARLLIDSKQVELPRGQVLIEPDEPPQFVYFPHRSMVSIVSLLASGESVEAAVVGKEGMVGIPIILGAMTTPAQALVQIPDGATRVSAEAVKAEFVLGLTLHRVILRYTHSMMIQASQTAVCNRLHDINERLCRWLLMCQDRVESADLALTHEFIATMLGTRRAAVTIALGTLETSRLIRRHRGKVTIRSRERLESATCECYGIIRAEEARYLHDTRRV